MIIEKTHPTLFDSKSNLFLVNKLFQALHDESKDDADSIHSFDLNESVSRIVTNVIDGFHDFTQDDLRKVSIQSGVRIPDGLCIHSMDSILSHAKFGPYDYRKDAPHFKFEIAQI